MDKVVDTISNIYLTILLSMGLLRTIISKNILIHSLAPSDNRIVRSTVLSRRNYIIESIIQWIKEKKSLYTDYV